MKVICYNVSTKTPTMKRMLNTTINCLRNAKNDEK